jgi:hypothetical protein
MDNEPQPQDVAVLVEWISRGGSPVIAVEQPDETPV